MESSHLLATFFALIALVVFALVIAALLAFTGKLNDALVVLLSGAITGAFTLLRAPSSKNVTVDNPPSDPVQVEAPVK